MNIKFLENGDYLLEIEGKEFSMKEIALYIEIMKNKQLVPEQFKEIENQWQQALKDYEAGKLNEEQKKFVDNIKKFSKEKGIEEVIYFGMVNLNNFLVEKVNKKFTDSDNEKQVKEGKLIIADIFDLAGNLQALLTGVKLEIATPLVPEEAGKIKTKISFF